MLYAAARGGTCASARDRYPASIALIADSAAFSGHTKVGFTQRLRRLLQFQPLPHRLGWELPHPACGRTGTGSRRAGHARARRPSSRVRARGL